MLSNIKQVVKLSHNFIVHIRLTEGHGATSNQMVSSDYSHTPHSKIVGVENVERSHWRGFLQPKLVTISVLWSAHRTLHIITYVPVGNIQTKAHENKNAQNEESKLPSELFPTQRKATTHGRHKETPSMRYLTWGFIKRAQITYPWRRLLLILTQHQSAKQSERCNRRDREWWWRVTVHPFASSSLHPCRRMESTCISDWIWGPRLVRRVMKEAQCVYSDGWEGERRFILFTPDSPSSFVSLVDTG